MIILIKQLWYTLILTESNQSAIYACVLFYLIVPMQWMEEILHQLIGGNIPLFIFIYRVSTILLVVQDFATINSMYVLC